MKINGISHTQILILTIFEYIIKIIPMVCICILLSYYFNNFILQQSLILGIEYCIFIMITFIINASYLNKLNIEKILRD